MKLKVSETQHALDIEISDTNGCESKLIAALKYCQEGNCGYPMAECRKLDSLEIEQCKDGVIVHLNAKKGATFDPSQIERCLKHTGEILSI